MKTWLGKSLSERLARRSSNTRPLMPAAANFAVSLCWLSLEKSVFGCFLVGVEEGSDRRPLVKPRPGEDMAPEALLECISNSRGRKMRSKQTHSTPGTPLSSALTSRVAKHRWLALILKDASSRPELFLRLWEG